MAKGDCLEGLSPGLPTEISESKESMLPSAVSLQQKWSLSQGAGGKRKGALMGFVQNFDSGDGRIVRDGFKGKIQLALRAGL
jgi:hypothetical protein